MLKLRTIFIYALLVVSALCATNSSTPLTTNDSDTLQYCAEKYNISLEELVKYLRSKTTDKSLEISYNIKCFTYCFLELGQVMQDGNFLYEQMSKRFHSYDAVINVIFQEMFKRCQNATVGIDDPCEAAYQLEMCFNLATNQMSSNSAGAVG